MREPNSEAALQERRQILAFIQVHVRARTWAGDAREWEMVAAAAQTQCGELKFNRDGSLRRKSEKQLVRWLDVYAQLREWVNRLDETEQWKLDARARVELTLASLPHARAVLRLRAGRIAPDSALPALLANFYRDSGTMRQFLEREARSSPAQPGAWESYLQRVVSHQLGMDAAQAAAFVSTCWDVLIQSVSHYHYLEEPATWFARVLLNYYYDAPLVQHLQAIAPPVVEQLLDEYLDSSKTRPEKIERLRTLARAAEIPEDALQVIEYIGDRARFLYAENPSALAVQSYQDFFKGLPQFYFGARVKTWTNSILLNRVKHLLAERGGQAVSLEPDPDAPLDELATAAHEMPAFPDRVEGLLEQAILAAAQHLRDTEITREQKEWIARLFFADDLSVDEIAATLVFPKNTILSILNRLRPYMIEWLQKHGMLPVLSLLIQQTNERAVRDSFESLPPGLVALRIHLENIGELDAPHLTLKSQAPLSTQWAARHLETISPFPSHAAATLDDSDSVLEWQGALKPQHWVRVNCVLQVQLDAGDVKKIETVVSVSLARVRLLSKKHVTSFG